ncbi:acyl-CoA dehydrogenase family protein [Streptomyces sp. NPDC055025]
MDFEIPLQTSQFEREIDRLMNSSEIQSLVREVSARADGMDGDVRPLYRRLGEHGILAPAWPGHLGGRDADFTATVVLLERMVRHGIPQSLYYISVQIFGSLILAGGTEKQRRELLPALARGELAACILFTEPDHGSDLAGITTTASRDGQEWVLEGRKIYNLKSAYADVALCVARTGGPDTSRYEALSLFLVPLDAPGVTVRPLPSLANEQFHDVRITGVRLPDEAIVGGVGQGWGLITRMFSAERSGLDYYVRARYWLDMIAERLVRGGRELQPHECAALDRARTRVDASRLLTCRALQRLQDDEPDIALASLAKWHCSETAQEVAWLGYDLLGLDLVLPRFDLGEPAVGPDRGWAALEAAHREAPGMGISGGASEVLLDIVAGARLIDIPEGG